jgi:SAM-dependent methyltransferase
MRRKLLKYLARRYNYDLVPKPSRGAPPADFPPPTPLPAWLAHSHDVLKHPMSGRLVDDYAPIPATGGKLYFRSSICTAADFRHAEFDRWRRILDEKPRMHRKIWEHVFIAAHFEAAGLLAQGRRGLGFGVGTESLPVAFAARGASVVATDMAPESATAAGWASTNQHSSSLADLNKKGLCPPEEFARRVSHQICDMNNVDPELRDFDFCWSACSLEHLGSIRAGLDFIRASVETLRPGGVAIHTTEYNVSSNDLTIDDNPTLVLYRRKDIEELVRGLRADGHHVADVCFDVLSEPIDLFVDVPPYTADPHIRLILGPFVSTSIAIVIQKKP